MGKRNLGSTRAAYTLGLSLIVGSIVLCGVIYTGLFQFSWVAARPFVDVGACLTLGGILLWWAWSADDNDHELNSAGKIGNETITMIAGVLAAVIAIITLVDTAATVEIHEKQLHDKL
jgi:small-conductance mechanosensitive channel